MTRLRLPEPAADLLAKTHHILDAFLTPVTPGRSGWALTGGTVLGARWRHRESSDLDLVVHPETEIARLAKKHNPDFWRAMETAGATGIEFEGTPTIHFPTGKIELITTPPVPRMGHTTEALETGRAVLLGPAQVLTGKLRHRSLAAPVRDLYDIAVGWRTDPAATTIAVNATSERTLAAASAHWKKRCDRYRDEARTELMGVPERFRDILADPAEQAGRAVREARYRYLVVASSPDAVTVTTRNRHRLAQRGYRTEDEARNGFEEEGLNACLAAQGWNPGRIRNQAMNARAVRRTETILEIGNPEGGEETPGGLRRRERSPHGGSRGR